MPARRVERRSNKPQHVSMNEPTAIHIATKVAMLTKPNDSEIVGGFVRFAGIVV